MEQATGSTPPKGGAPARHEGAGAKRPKRASKGQVRTWAWLAGAMSFAAPWAVFGISPKPAAGQTAGQTVAAPGTHVVKPRRPVVIVITKKVIYTKTAAPPVTTTSGGGGVTYVPAPAAPPVTVSCGTHPC